MKIWLHSPKESWIVDRLVSEFVNDNNDIITQYQSNADLIWFMAGWCIDQLQKTSIPVISTVHHIVENKSSQREHILKHDHLVTAYHVPNERTQKQLQKLTKKPIIAVPYWIDTKTWSKITQIDRELARNSLGIDTTQYVIGSFQRDSEGFDNNIPKLEKGPDIFCDYVENIAKQKNVLVLLSGYRRNYVMNRLKQANIKFVYLEQVPQMSMSWLYAALDLYVVSSRCEGGPQALLECAYLEVPIISTPVGLAENILDSKSINIDLTKAVPNIETASYKIQNFITPHAYLEYRNMFTKILGELK